MRSGRSVLIGEVCLIGTGLFEGLYPVVISAGAAVLPPLTFLALSIAVAVVCTTIALLLRRKKIFPLPRQAVLLGAGVAFFILLGFLIVLNVAPHTSSVTIALLLRAELLGAFFISVAFLGERPTPLQVSGALLIFLGTLLVVFREGVTFHAADILIIAAALLFPFGNICAKRALALVAPEVLLLLRYVIGLLVLVPLAILFEHPFATLSHLSLSEGFLILAYGLPILTLSKIFWYVGLRVVPLGRATLLGDTAPGFTMLFAFLFLHETSGIVQWAGLILLCTGVYALMKRPSVSAQLGDLV